MMQGAFESIVVTKAAAVIPVVAIAALIVLSLSRTKDSKYPPSPPADPIIGHARIMPLEYAWETFAEWAKTYGDVIHARVFGRSILILDSAAAARDLMEKRGAIYSDKPHFVVLGDLLGWENILPFIPYGDRFRKQRRLMQQHFNSEAVESFRPLQTAQTRKFLQELLRAPDDFRDLIHRLIASTILMATYGHEVVSDNDTYVTNIEEATKLSVEVGSPGSTLFDFAPFLLHLPSWLPGMGLKRYCQKVRLLVDEANEAPFDGVKAQQAAGTARPSFVAHMLNDYENMQVIDPEHERSMKGIAASVYSAGTDTSATQLTTFFLMMTRHHEVVKRAQEEIDRVVGQNRLPTIEDRPNLPYIDCIMKEVFRIYPAAPLGIPHRLTKDDEYRGWKIPEGTMIIPNIWSMMGDKNYYPEPETFNPDRFLGKSSKMADDDGYEGVRLGQVTPDDPSTLIFGFGRRLCPGRFLADASIWITMANVLAAFDINPVIDPVSGEELLPAMEFVSGVTTPPKPFKCIITPRSTRHVMLIEREI